MKVGDIVRLKSDHHLTEFIKGDCIITEVRKFNIGQRKNRYHIETVELDNDKPSMTWVYLEELDLISHVRNQKLERLGI